MDELEAGALAHLPTVAPFLFRVDRTALGHSPLTQFQLTEFGGDDERNREECYRLIESINDSLAEEDRLAQDVLMKNFEHWWRELSNELEAIPDVSPGETRTAYKWLRTFEDRWQLPESWRSRSFWSTATATARLRSATPCGVQQMRP